MKLLYLYHVPLFPDCKCQWGLFRDRNITMRKPVRFLTGVTDLSEKGIVTEYDGSTELNWWRKGSVCDKVKGQDSSTLPPQVRRKEEETMHLAKEIFKRLRCSALGILNLGRDFRVRSGR